MAFRAAMLRSAGGNMGCSLGLRRSTHAIAQSAPLDSSINDPMTISPHLILAEFDLNSENRNIEFGFPSFSFGGGSMELMAVPKKKFCQLGFSPQVRHKKWTEGSQTYSSDHPLQELRLGQATTLLLLQWR